MGLKEKLLKRKEEVPQSQHVSSSTVDSAQNLAAPEFTFIRTTTDTQEVIVPPSYPGDAPVEIKALTAEKSSNRFSRFRRHTSAAQEQATAEKLKRISLDVDGGGRPKSTHRLSEKLHLTRDRSVSSGSSVNIPNPLPDIEVTGATPTTPGPEKDEREARWEKRATILAQSNPNRRRGSSANRSEEGGESVSIGVAAPGEDDDIQEAIRLHEAGDLERSTAMFGRLASPHGKNNALSQVLYGLALRHGWGCKPDPQLAITYLSQAASNSAEVESLALAAGLKKGGSAKGELVLAIFELANCFRNGWGVQKDAFAAKQYYETAANLGDTDAMEMVAWCYLEGFGTKKDKFKAAQYLRRAEAHGTKAVGNNWIWKDKYGGPKKVEPSKPKA